MPRQPRDFGMWREAVRDVVPLRGRAVPATPPAKPAPAEAGPPIEKRPLRHATVAGVDRANAERLKRGQWPIEARLDLHGKTQIEAHRALAAFVLRSREAGYRCVLVITGRG